MGLVSKTIQSTELNSAAARTIPELLRLLEPLTEPDNLHRLALHPIRTST
ncbi:MAG TPA: hypothetical protein V6D34_13995 [Candidatus Sericytochromatia bacterium]